MNAIEVQCLRVLITNDRRERLELLAEVVARLGHDPIVRRMRQGRAADVVDQVRPDIVVVGVEPSSEHGLKLITELVQQASCPVIASLASGDARYIRDAARRGVFACVVHDDVEELESAIDVALQRFAEYHSLQDAFARRAVIEQAKGILMARHGVDAEAAFAMLRRHSQNSGRKLAEIAEGVIETHQLLSPTTPGTAQSAEAE